jgi:hypothetical protein
VLTTLFRDRLPKGLCFPIGVGVLTERVSALSKLNAAAVFMWQSTWASQLFDAKSGAAGKLTVMHIRPDLPRMRINHRKVREMPPDCRIVVSEFAVSSDHRSHVLTALADHGASLLEREIEERPQPNFLLHYEIDTGRFTVAKNRQDVW